ncbi:hypothetical protein, partial [Algiphilus sp.]|uniref:hypothetical protein n=1 Tax=Algiphilus sp. TaxID=1872431 RepID=UPI0025B7D100
MKEHLKTAAALSLFAIFIIWVAGFLVYFFSLTAHHHKECINEKGWLVGLAWGCENPRHTMAKIGLTSVIWPIDLTQSLLIHLQHDGPSATTPQEQIEQSTIDGIYLCQAIAERLNRPEDNRVLSTSIELIRTIAPNHDHSDAFLDSKTKC